MGVPSPFIGSIVASPLRCNGTPVQCTPEPTETGYDLDDGGDFLLPVAMIDKDLPPGAANNGGTSTVDGDDAQTESENIPTSDSAGQERDELESKEALGAEESMQYNMGAQPAMSAPSSSSAQMWPAWGEDASQNMEGWDQYYAGEQTLYDAYGNPMVCAVYAVPVPAEEEMAMQQQSYPAPPPPHPRKAEQPPPIPQHEGAYRPRWVYGWSWPFNTAPTTLIVENLPSELTQSRLLEVLDDWGFCGYYDFVFLPVNLRTGRSQRHALINVTRHSVGLALADRLHGFCDWGVGDGSRRCEANWSLPTQGLAELVENHRNHAAMHELVEGSLKPMLFTDGWQVPFPAPTRWIRNPFQGSGRR
mmetsp:Transcript_58983/g.140836  ORF Transcript_58983/g.140836 Transcript_58983/m.140836 type:complete len:361 (+) Transcript_58983:200-1282(+)